MTTIYNTLVQKKVLRKLQNGNPITSSMIDELIVDFTNTQKKTQNLWNRYLGDVPIKQRKVPRYAISNEKLSNDVAGLIINNKVGYFSGIPINYAIDKTTYNIPTKDDASESESIAEQLYKHHNKVLSDFNKLNNTHNLDSEMTKIVSVCGGGARKYYSDKYGNIRMVNLKPFEVILLINEHNEVEYALRFYKEYNLNDELLTHVEFYTDTSITYYVENNSSKKVDKDSKYVLNSEYSINPQPHVFDFCPFAYFQNNDESMSDLEKVNDLIDAYNKVVSNNNNELNGFSLAYMLFKGVELKEEEVKKLKELGALEVSENGEVSFLTKQLDATFGDSFLDRVEDNIYQFAQAVNFNDEKFQSASGVALKYKLQALDNKCIALESKFQRSLNEQFKIVSSAWKKLNIDINYLDMYFTFKRNVVPDLDYEATVAGKLMGIVSQRTILGLMSFVDDVEYELMELDKETQAKSTQFTNPNPDASENYNLDNVDDE